MTVVMLVALGLGIVGVIVWRTWGSYRGGGRWTAANLLTTVSFFLFAMRGIWPDVLTISGANALAIIGAVLYFEVVRVFCGLSPQRWVPYTSGAVAFSALSYFEFNVDDIQARVLIFSLFMCIISMAGAVTLFNHMPERGQVGFGFTGVVLALFSLGSFIRAIGSFATESHQPFFAQTPMNTGFFVANVLARLHRNDRKHRALHFPDRRLLVLHVLDEEQVRAFHLRRYGVLSAL